MWPQTEQPFVPRWKRAIAVLAAWSLLAQALLAAFAVPAAFAALRPGLILPEGYSQILICTGSGMKRIVVDADGNRVGDSEEGQEHGCVACHFTGCPGLGAPAAPVLSLPAQLVCHAAPLPGIVAQDADFLCPHSRGPPSIVIDL